MKIVICQKNPIVGDVIGNAHCICDTVLAVKKSNPDLIVFPELFIQGYPPRDLLEQEWFIRNGLKALETVIECSRTHKGIGILTGMALPNDTQFGKRLHNAAVLIYNGEKVFQQSKSLLPTYDVFDETRYFDAAGTISVFPFKGEKLGISICEDAWNHEDLWTGIRYNRNPINELAAQGATLFINIAASPFHIGKENLRVSLARNHAKRHGKPFLYVNQIGGNDELIFDGSSMFFNGQGNLITMLPAFSEAIELLDTSASYRPIEVPDFDTIEAVRNALLLGIRDYTKKCGFRQVLLGLSGGIDSALTCALAVQALGAENVWGIALPSRYSSEGSVIDARALAENLGIRFSVIPIENSFGSLKETLAPEFEGTAEGIAEENLQARIRGMILMALSNKFGHLLLTTGNKSELSVGYCTLYGDMNGGLSVINDLPKEMVFDLARFINESANRVIIPVSTLEKPPSAELRPDQTDQDTLPPYSVLDAILEGLVEKGLSASEIIKQGYDEKTVRWVCKAIASNEYKRRQAAPGLKVSPKAFGIGRRFPIAARYDWG